MADHLEPLFDQYKRRYGTPRPAPAAAAGAPSARAAARLARLKNSRGSRPNAGVEAAYRSVLVRLVRDMAADVLANLRAAYGEAQPVMAQDAYPEGGMFDEAARRDRLGYHRGLKWVTDLANTSKWHSYYDADKDEIGLEAKFWDAPAAERLHMLLHEIGHRGQEVDPGAYAAFKKLHENTIPNFEAMANPVHLKDERAGHLHDIAEEVFAESYARWCLGLTMPSQLRVFWDARAEVGGQDHADVLDGSSGDFLLHSGIGRGHQGDEDALAFDRSPADWLKSAFDALARRWLARFDAAAPALAAWFAQASGERSDAQLHRILRDGGFSVRFEMSPAMRDVLDATVHENVGLIRSIPQQYLTNVEGAVMRSVTAGRDLASLSTALREHHGVTKRRAGLIARDQNNKATAAFTRVRQVDLGLKAIWMHSHAGKTPRPTHLKNNGKPYDPAEGWLDPAVGRRIWPGELINCRCFSRTVVPGFE